MTQRKCLTLTLPFASTAVTQAPQLLTDGADLVLAMEFLENGLRRPFRLRFRKHRAHRMRAESYCTAWHIESVYDTVCEVVGSSWIKELRADAAPEWRDYWVMKHFMIYVDSFGCLEVIAESAALDDGAKNSGGT
jgi:hypothetical protein